MQVILLGAVITRLLFSLSISGWSKHASRRGLLKGKRQTGALGKKGDRPRERADGRNGTSSNLTSGTCRILCPRQRSDTLDSRTPPPRTRYKVRTCGLILADTLRLPASRTHRACSLTCGRTRDGYGGIDRELDAADLGNKTLCTAKTNWENGGGNEDGKSKHKQLEWGGLKKSLPAQGLSASIRLRKAANCCHVFFPTYIPRCPENSRWQSRSVSAVQLDKTNWSPPSHDSVQRVQIASYTSVQGSDR